MTAIPNYKVKSQTFCVVDRFLFMKRLARLLSRSLKHRPKENKLIPDPDLIIPDEFSSWPSASDRIINCSCAFDPQF